MGGAPFGPPRSRDPGLQPRSLLQTAVPRGNAGRADFSASPSCLDVHGPHRSQDEKRAARFRGSAPTAASWATRGSLRVGGSVLSGLSLFRSQAPRPKCSFVWGHGGGEEAGVLRNLALLEKLQDGSCPRHGVAFKDELGWSTDTPPPLLPPFPVSGLRNTADTSVGGSVRGQRGGPSARYGRCKQHPRTPQR